MRSAAALVKALGLRDLRGRWVFPRLLLIVFFHAIARVARRSFAFATHPVQRTTDLFRVLHEYRENLEIVLAGAGVLTAFLQASALLLVAIAVLVFAISRL